MVHGIISVEMDIWQLIAMWTVIGLVQMVPAGKFSENLVELYKSLVLCIGDLLIEEIGNLIGVILIAKK